MANIRCKLFGHRWQYYAVSDEHDVTIQRCERCHHGRKILWHLGDDYESPDSSENIPV